MEQKRNIVLEGTETFSRGALDNVALSDGCIVLDSVAGRHMQYGCYTGPELAMPPFCSLNVSWNGNVPKNTVVEAMCRVFADGSWTSWFSFGKWAPDYPAKSSQSRGAVSSVFISGDTITVAAPGGATGLQLQAALSTNDERVTPELRLLAAAVRPLQWEKQEGVPLNRSVYLPEYCLASHDPSFGGEMDLPIILAGMMNRYGEDVLPEELAYTMADAATAGCHNAAYAAASAGSCGYQCFQAWMDLKELRWEIHNDCAVAVEIESAPGRRDASRVWMGLHGFGHEEGVKADYVLLNDPGAETDDTVSRRVSLKDFLLRFTGRALVLRPKKRGVWGLRPQRIRCGLTPGALPGEYMFDCRGEPLPLPESFSGWLAAAPNDGTAHATTARKTFYRLGRSPEGGVVFPAGTPFDEGGRFGVYAVEDGGVMRVSELRLPARPAPEAPKVEAEVPKAETPETETPMDKTAKAEPPKAASEAPKADPEAPKAAPPHTAPKESRPLGQL